MRVKQNFYIEDSTEIGKLILEKINTPGITKQDVFRDLIVLGVLAQRAGIHAIGERIVYLPETSIDSLMFASGESQASFKAKIEEPLHSVPHTKDSVPVPAKNMLETPTPVTIVPPAPIPRKVVPLVDPTLLGNLRNLASGSTT